MKFSTAHVSGWRYYLVIVFILLVGAALEARLFYLQVKRGTYYSVLAREAGIVPSLPLRGSIYFKNRFGKVYPAALSKASFALFAVPKDMHNFTSVSGALAPIVEKKAGEIEAILGENPKSAYVELASGLDKEKADEIKSLKLQGVGVFEQQIRTYPYGNLAANTLGFLSYAEIVGRGQYGIEEYYEKILAQSDTKKGEDAAEVGDSLYLTIDYTAQQETEKILAQLIENFKSPTGTIIVMEPRTGAIIALANYPNFDPNKYGEVESLAVFKNSATQQPYEPGSVMKIFTMAAGLEEKVITPRTTYEDMGEVKIKNVTIRNYDRKAHGIQTMTQVLEKSLNTGSIFVQQKINKKTFFEYIKSFGFDEKTNIDLAGETKGNIDNLKNFNDVDFAAASFGQGISATPLQIVSAISAVANQGIMMQPYIVEKRVRADGSNIITEPKKIAEPISPFIASQLTGMLVSVAENGLDKKASVPGYQVAVKTGTAQIAISDGSGYSDKAIHTIVGYAPALNPQFVILMRIDEPKGLAFAADTLGTPFSTLTRFLLNYYDIPPESAPH